MSSLPDNSSLSLADFYYHKSSDPLKIPAEWGQWCAQTQIASSLYGRCLMDGAKPVTRLNMSDSDSIINMASYNYLGMVDNKDVINRSKEALDKYGLGACGSPLLSGMTNLHRELEQRMAKFLKKEDCILFNSGFSGALGLISGILRRNDIAFMDEKSHVSLVNGGKLSGAKIKLFRHNDASHLDEMLEKYQQGRKVIVVEGLYSMDGNYANLPEIVAVAKKHNVGIIIDEAHSILTCGENGRGAVEKFNCADDITLQYGTFSKGFAGIGGFVCGPKDLIDYLRFFSSSYGFSCALPPSMVAGLIAVLDIVERDSAPRKKMVENADYFRCELNKIGVNTGESCSQIVPIIIGNDRKLLYKLSALLEDKGLFVAPVDYPSVPKNSLRFRASVTAAHTKEQLDRSINIIKEVALPHLTV